MGSLVSRLDERLYPAFTKNWDDRLFRERVLAVVQPDWHLLDLGAGAGLVREMNFRGVAARTCGIDPDRRVLTNPYLDEAKIGTGDHIAYPDDTFDIVIADNVLEHLDDPLVTFREVRRVLKAGGYFLFKTPNLFHYMPLISMCTPTWFHKAFNRARGRPGLDTFPTRYRANSGGKIAGLAAQAGFEVVYVECIEGRPEYLRFSFPTYVIGWIYERVVNSTQRLEPFRIVMIGALRSASAV
jgi:SAM-dependent methyltransferase